ncbi:MAG: permease [bacterium]
MIKYFADWITYDVLSLSPKRLLAEAVNFFIYDTIKIFFLLAVIIFTISLIRSFLPPEKIRNILSAKRRHYGHILAALLGIVTPFCSCSAIPLFLGFVEAGVPLGVTFSFLISSPMINEVALVLLLGLFGWRLALIYAFSGLVIAILSGIVIGHLNVESLVEDFVYQSRTGGHNTAIASTMSWPERIQYARTYTLDIIRQIWPHIIIGIGIGAWIHGYVPTDFLARYAGRGNWYAVPLATLIGIPLYSNAAGVIPLISVLTEKGVSIGTSLAFMMAVVGLSLPAFMILRKVMKVRLLIIFAGIVGAGIIFTGYLFNFIL